MAFAKEYSVLIVLVLLRIFFPIIQILRDFKIITIDTSINFIDISDFVGYLIVIAIIYFGIKYYLKGELQ